MAAPAIAEGVRGFAQMVGMMVTVDSVEHLHVHAEKGSGLLPKRTGFVLPIFRQ